MKPIMLALAAVLAAAPAAAAAQDDPAVARQAEAFQPIVGQVSPDGAVIRSVEAQGHDLVFRVTIPDDYSFPVEEAAEALSQGMCEDGDGIAFFREGRTLRVEMSASHGPPRIATRDRCPATRAAT